MPFNTLKYYICLNHCRGLWRSAVTWFSFRMLSKHVSKLVCLVSSATNNIAGRLYTSYCSLWPIYIRRIQRRQPKRRQIQNCDKPKLRYVQNGDTSKRRDAKTATRQNGDTSKTARRQNGDTSKRRQSNLIYIQNFSKTPSRLVSKTATNSKRRQPRRRLNFCFGYTSTRRFGDKSSWVVAVLTCHRLRFVDVFVLSPFWIQPKRRHTKTAGYVVVLDVSPFWRVAVLDVLPFWLSHAQKRQSERL